MAMRKVFRDKRDFINYIYRGKGCGGISAADMKKLNDKIHKIKIQKNIHGSGGTISSSYKIALQNKIITLKKK